MSDHKVGEVQVKVRVDQQVVATLTMTYASVGPLLADVSQVILRFSDVCLST